MNFLKNFEVRECGAPISAASSTDSNSDIIDMANYGGVTFMCSVTDSTATGVATLTAEQDAANADTSMAALSGAVATATCTTSDDLNNELLIVEVSKPAKRYVQVVRTSGTANIAFGTCYAILSGKRKGPVSDHSSVLDSALAVSPVEG